MDTDRKWNERRDKMLAEAFGFKKRDAVIPVATPTCQTLMLDIGEALTMAFMLIPAGQFTMGSPEIEKGHTEDEVQHEVTISQPFYMGKFQVTQGQWQAVMGSNPSDLRVSDFPVTKVSWDDCQEFCKKLSAKAGKTVRLPTEAEWEYACRAGSATRFCSGDSDIDLNAFAWCYNSVLGLTIGQEAPVGQKRPNAWWLHDMHGNVCEWCHDWYDNSYYENSPRTNPRGPDTGSERVLRGGSWNYMSEYCRSANRNSSTPCGRSIHYGFRCVLVH